METTLEPQTSITSPKGHTLSLQTTQKSIQVCKFTQCDEKAITFCLKFIICEPS